MKLYLIPVLLLLLFGSCRQAQDLKAFTEAKYRLEGVENVQLNGVDIQERLQAQSGVRASERDSLLLFLTTNQLRLNANLGLHVSLPDSSSERTLTVTKLRWLLQVAGQDALTGTVEKTMVLREGLNKIPITTPVQLTEDKGQPNYAGLNRLINLIAQGGDIKSNITFQIRPTIKTPLGNIESPKYIIVSRPPNT